jgi:hypothetical protein
MAQWGRNDQSVTANSTTTKETSNGAPIGTYALVKGAKTSSTGTAPVSGLTGNANFGNTSPASKASIDVTMYGNTTIGAFVNNQAVGIFAVNATMMSTFGGNVVIAYVTSGGSGYQANTANFTPTVTNGGSGASVNAVANVTTSNGHITSLNIVANGNGYITPPTLSIPAPAAINITANSTGFANGTVAGAGNSAFLQTNNQFWQVGDRLFYGVPAANTPIAPLSGNTYYYISFANTTVIKLANTATGANIIITDTRVLGAAETHTITGDTATGYVDVNTDNPLVSHVGWIKRTEGTGGRAGRVQYETLVAMHSIGVNGTTATGVTGVATVTSNTTVDGII